MPNMALGFPVKLPCLLEREVIGQIIIPCLLEREVIGQIIIPPTNFVGFSSNLANMFIYARQIL